MHPTKSSMGADIRARSVELLNRHLAATIDLRAQVKHAHWNVRGPNFIATHELFDKIACRVDAYSDTIAERAAALGGVARGTLQAAADRSFLAPYRLEVADEQSHLFALSSAIASLGASVHEAIAKAAMIGDAVTADVFTEICRGLDSDLWLLESHSPPQTQGLAPAALAVVRTERAIDGDHTNHAIHPKRPP